MKIAEDNDWWFGLACVIVILAIIAAVVFSILGVRASFEREGKARERTELEHERLLRDRLQNCLSIEDEAIRALCTKSVSEQDN